VGNLLNNAAKFTAPGGRITLAACLEDEHAVIRVTDNGIGIAAEQAETIFDLFAQAGHSPDRVQDGLGIGLSLVRTLVNLHRGSVSVHSPGLGQGSTFEVRLPRAAVPPPALRAPPAVALRPTPHALRLLVVDDNEDAANTLAAVLGLLGHETCVVHTAAAALAQTAPFDACVLDIGLPDMSGHELATTLRARGHGGVYIALTGYGQPQDRVMSRAAGFDHHFVKPVDIARLAEVLAAVVPAHAQPA
jgi:CheY-like chemotaxis protein